MNNNNIVMHMIMILTLFLNYAIKYSNAVVIAPGDDTSGLGITVSLTSDPRGLNEVNGDNEWSLYQHWNNPLGDWYINFYIYLYIYIYMYETYLQTNCTCIYIQGNLINFRCNAIFI